MVVGHCIIIDSGAVFDLRAGERYNVSTRWVSDFAAKWPEGLWIKGAIVFFCLALVGFFHAVIGQFSSRRFAGLLKFWWLLLATAMIGGLALVVLFDMSPAQYQFEGPNWFSRLLGNTGGYTEVQRSAADWSMRWHHQLGFRLFVGGFFVSSVSLAWSEIRAGISAAIPATAYLLLLAFILSGWLFYTQTTIAGIPQRALLLLIFIWLLRSLAIISAAPAPSLKRIDSQGAASAVSGPGEQPSLDAVPRAAADEVPVDGGSRGGSFLRRLLRCETLEDCSRIQHGQLLLRRLGKWSILFTIGVTLVLNDYIARGIGLITSQYSTAQRIYSQATDSVAYRWTFGLFYPAPELPPFDDRAIMLYNILNWIQFAVFLLTMLYALRWTYADCRVQGSKTFTFKRILGLALVSNMAVYFGLRSLIQAYQ
jgi:hypothetical protein